MHLSNSARPQLTPAELAAFGRDLDAVRERVLGDLGERDAAYIRRVVRAQRRLEVAGRALLQFSLLPPAWLAGTGALALSKILDNMEIGHNLAHGQYDWMRDPDLHSQSFEWDIVSPISEWKRSHNFHHHEYTNILGRDRDIGYALLRVSDEQCWHWHSVFNPAKAVVLAAFFQWGVALHDLEIERMGRPDGPTPAEVWRRFRIFADKAGRQLAKDYVVFPLLAGPGAGATLAGNLVANHIRNVWAFTVIFCGHFPDGAQVFSVAETAEETRGGWYLRQLLGSANIDGGPLMHLLTGNLSHQIEHHLFPDLPAHRYAEIAPEVRAICRRYGLPYNSGSLARQVGSVARKIVRLALPPRAEVAPPVARIVPAAA